MRSISKSILSSCWKNSKIEALRPADSHLSTLTREESTQLEEDYAEWNEALHGEFDHLKSKLISI